MDMATDNFIQKVIKEKIKDTTVITIAHRLSTIADYDQILVMRNGEIAESGVPYSLIEKKGLFFDMVNQTGKHASIIVSMARASYEAKFMKM